MTENSSGLHAVRLRQNQWVPAAVAAMGFFGGWGVGWGGGEGVLPFFASYQYLPRSSLMTENQKKRAVKEVFAGL